MKLIGEKTINMKKKSPKKKTYKINNKVLYPNIKTSNRNMREIKERLKNNNIIRQEGGTPDKLLSNLYTLCLNSGINVHI